jgi:hypothetical protein
VTTLLAIDPGLGGAIAVLDASTGDLLDLRDTPCSTGRARKRVREADLAHLIRDLAATHRPVAAACEATLGRPPMSAMAAHTLGLHSGLVRGVCAALGLPVALLPPRGWKAALGLTADKAGSLALARRTWPEHAETRFARARDEGRAEAALIGLAHIRHPDLAIAASD